MLRMAFSEREEGNSYHIVLGLGYTTEILIIIYYSITLPIRSVTPSLVGVAR